MHQVVWQGDELIDRGLATLNNSHINYSLLGKDATALAPASLYSVLKDELHRDLLAEAKSGALNLSDQMPAMPALPELKLVSRFDDILATTIKTNNKQNKNKTRSGLLIFFATSGFEV